MTQDTSRSVHFSRFGMYFPFKLKFEFPANHILQVSCDWILCCDWYTLHGLGLQTARWPRMSQIPSHSLEWGLAMTTVTAGHSFDQPFSVVWPLTKPIFGSWPLSTHMYPHLHCIVSHFDMIIDRIPAVFLSLLDRRLQLLTDSRGGHSHT